MDAALIVGLGNPGPAYAQTRHNLGFMVVDELCRRAGCSWTTGADEYALAAATSGGSALHLLKPLTFMNLSGSAVARALASLVLPEEALLIVTDDFQIPLGTIRMRARGSDGGHHGLASVIEALGTDRFPRLRCGIGREAMPPGERRRDFVLSPFDPEEQKAVEAMIARAADAAAAFATAGIDRAMSEFNSK
ncbi:MAG: aminoacyl-tRNA hydrolase [Bacteroidota bacterium]